MKQLTQQTRLQLNKCNCYECQAMEKQGYIFFTYDMFHYFDALSKRVSTILGVNVVYYCGRWLRISGLET